MILIKFHGQSSMEWKVLMMLERLFSEIANEHAPLKYKRVKGSKTPWVTPNLAEMKRDKNYHFRKARTTNSTSHWRMYRKLRNCKHQS